MSAETLEFHHGKHHQAYIDNLNKMTHGQPEERKSLEEIITSVPAGSLFNNAAQAWNHAFFWSSLSPNGGNTPAEDLARAIDRDFGSLSGFLSKFTASATSLFGSGWVWLVVDGEQLEIVQTHDAATPITSGQTPLFTIDVWEHAYYVDYRNSRLKYVETVLDHLINWEFASANYATRI